MGSAPNWAGDAFGRSLVRTSARRRRRERWGLSVLCPFSFEQAQEGATTLPFSSR